MRPIATQETPAPGHPPVLELTGDPPSSAAWLRDVWAHRSVLVTLARSDFHVRYKRATFGVLWSVAVPLLQAGVLVAVFSRFARFEDVPAYGVFVISGIVAWSYLTGTLSTASTAIVEGASLTDKVWFPRALLALVPPLANLVGLAVSLVVVVALLPFDDVDVDAKLLLLPAAVALLVAFVSSLGLVLSALHVYFRDVRFLVQAVLVAWFWVTPIAYPQSFAEDIGPWLDANPATGVVTMFRVATIGAADYQRPVLVAVGTTVALLVAAIAIHRRHDRLFVDLL